MPLVWAWSIKSRTKSWRMFSWSLLYFQVIGNFSTAERPADPEQQGVAAVVVDAVHDLLPVSQVVGRHPHEGDVVAPLGEGARIPSRSRVRGGQEQQGDQDRAHHAHDLLGLRAARTIVRG